MDPLRLQKINAAYAKLRIAIVGDFCLDRYLEIDPAKKEISIETGRPVHNVVNVRSQPGGAGTILNNLVALGVGTIFPVGFCGEDGEGFELRRALEKTRGVNARHFLQTSARRTFTYCKPLVIRPNRPPEELNRLDSKNWTATPTLVQRQIASSLAALAPRVDAMILLDQVDLPETGVITRAVLRTVAALVKSHPRLQIISDSRRGLKDYPPVILKMNRAELRRLTGGRGRLDLSTVKKQARQLAAKNKRMVFVTLSEDGMLGASPTGEVEHLPAFPIRGPIDIVGAGDAVTANLIAALTAGASLIEALELASAAASLVIHQLGTTGTASIAGMARLLSRHSGPP